MHGKTSRIHHDSKTIFRDLPQDFEATRYHSLTVE
jgi:anthranilate/para-aminobenzoate synthase component II